VNRFRGGLVFKDHGLLNHSTLGLRVIKKKKKFVTRAGTTHAEMIGSARGVGKGGSHSADSRHRVNQAALLARPCKVRREDAQDTPGMDINPTS